MSSTANPTQTLLGSLVVSVPGSALLDLGDVQLKQVVEPAQELLSAWSYVSAQFHAIQGWLSFRGEDRTWIHPWWGSDNRCRDGRGMDEEDKEEEKWESRKVADFAGSGPPEQGLPLVVMWKQWMVLFWCQNPPITVALGTTAANSLNLDNLCLPWISGFKVPFNLQLHKL